ncbi:MAG: uL15m family ribosomal protein [Candidatus Nanohaloarchaea archaeon]
MTKRRSKKNKSGSHGYGSSKKNRGAGNKGGRGNSGRGKKAKHKKMTKEGVHQLGERGFNSRKEPQTGINLRDIDQRIEEFVEEGVAEETDDGYVFHADKAGYDKVLGKGRLYRDIEIHAKKFSDSAKEKIEEAGQEVVEVEE